MKINQLFKEKVPDDVLTAILRAFKLGGLDDNSCFSKEDLEKYKTIEQIETLKEQLRQYYLPCKFKIYLERLTAGKCITILRQVLKLFQVKLISRQKYIKRKKITLYSILKSDRHLQTSVQVDHQCTKLIF
jgi:hypothetical protein